MYNICIYTFIILAQALQDSTAVQEKGVRKISICIHNIYTFPFLRVKTCKYRNPAGDADGKESTTAHSQGEASARATPIFITCFFTRHLTRAGTLRTTHSLWFLLLFLGGICLGLFWSVGFFSLYPVLIFSLMWQHPQEIKKNTWVHLMEAAINATVKLQFTLLFPA